jgi:hypothetical protein
MSGIPMVILLLAACPPLPFRPASARRMAMNGIPMVSHNVLLLASFINSDPVSQGGLR